MITPRDITDGLSICTGYDPIHTPMASEVIVRAWMDHFGHHLRIGREQFLAAMRAYWQVPGRSFPQPAQISMLVSELAMVGQPPVEVPNIGLPSPAECAASAEQRRAHLAEISQIIQAGRQRARAS